MSTTTTNLGLIKPELTDAADITAMNENWDKIDSKIQEQIAHKANTSNPHNVTAKQTGGLPSEGSGNSLFGNDLNDWREPGIYSTNSATTNYPTEAATAYASVFVIGTWASPTRCTQVYIPWINDKAGTLYTRHYNNGDWDGWKEIGIAKYGYGYFDSPMKSGDNANTYLTPGCYGVTSNAIAESISNLPTQVAGLLEVRCSTGDSKTTGSYAYITQTYTPYDSPFSYTRTANTSAEANQWIYGSWSQYYSTNNKPSASDIGAATANHTHQAADVGALPIGGGTLTGTLSTKGIVLAVGTDYGTELPSTATAGKLFFLKA